MSFSRPTLQQLYERISKDFSGQLLDGSPLLPASVLSVISSVWAGATHMLHGFLAYIFKQAFIDTADAEYLPRWARVWGILPTPATFAVGKVGFRGMAGKIIPAEAVLVSKAGQTYKTLQDAVAGVDVVQIIGTEAGSQGNLPLTETLALVSPVAGVEMEASLALPLQGGVDAEGVEALRSRLLARLRRPPRGGSAEDYETWAKEVAGVTNVYVDPLNQGLGTVALCFLSSELDSAPFPSPELVSRVQAHVDSKRPVTAEVFVFAPKRQDITLHLAISPNNAKVRSAVNLALHQFFAEHAYPACTILKSHLSEVISGVVDEQDHVVLEPEENIICPIFTMPVLVAVEFEDI